MEAQQGAAASEAPVRDADAEVVAFLRGRSAPCPRCAYDLRDLDRAQCPECGEPLVLKVGSPRTRFGWLVVAMAPGCFSGVAAVLLFVPIFVSTAAQRFQRSEPVPWPLLMADAFGFLSAGSVVLMYRKRHRMMAWPDRRQKWFACGVWGVHIVMFVTVVGSMILLFN